MIKVIATDMDGTFLDDKGSYDRQRFEHILTQLKERDIRFVVASGNHMERLAMIFDGMVDDISYVAENGAHVIEQGYEIVHHHLAKEDVFACLDYFQGKHKEYRVIVQTDQGMFMVDGATFNPDEFMISEEQMSAFLSRITFISDFNLLPQDASYIKMSMMFPIEQCDALIADFNAHFTGNITAVTSGYGSVDMSATGIHKAWGLQKLLERWEVSPEEVMAFGDADNDIELLKMAGYSYAMTNASDKVKAAANFIAPHHRDQGVLEILDHFLELN
ncbi:Cof-type HAD-IIB family hydrolase [Streptococcus fryi]